MSLLKMKSLSLCSLLDENVWGFHLDLIDIFLMMNSWIY
jgi:hypothetical protein